jgi:hypothetical protein
LRDDHGDHRDDARAYLFRIHGMTPVIASIPQPIHSIRFT